MKRSRMVLAAALILFVVSFFVAAVGKVGGGGISPSIFGYDCAYITLLAPWTRESLSSFHEEPLLFFAILLSGWITPVFLITISLLMKKSTYHAGRILRVALLLIFPACWIVFSHENIRPGPGYFLWTGAMMLAVFSDLFERKSSPEPNEELVLN